MRDEGNIWRDQVLRDEIEEVERVNGEKEKKKKKKVKGFRDLTSQFISEILP